MGDSTRDATVSKMFASLDRVVWGITAATDDARGGLLATWVMQTSLDMASPGLMVGLAPNHFTTELIEASGRFVVHLLSPDQIDVALQLAIGSGRDRDKLAGLTCLSGLGYPIGDIPFLGRVPGLRPTEDGRPHLLLGGRAGGRVRARLTGMLA